MKKRTQLATTLGDSGTTKILGQPGRVSKNHDIVEYIGTIDELQSVLGTLELEELDTIQDDLYRIMSGEDVSPDWMDTTIPNQTAFVLPRGMIHVARAVCRRAERRGVTAGRDITYLNRLSDYLYKLTIE